jgi:hypothetical protein
MGLSSSMVPTLDSKRGGNSLNSFVAIALAPVRENVLEPAFFICGSGRVQSNGAEGYYNASLCKH